MSIYVQHITGYGHDIVVYTERAKRLEAAGFVRLQSEPRPDGKRWEVWYFPGWWAAKGELETLVDAAKVAWRTRNPKNLSGTAERQAIEETIFAWLQRHIKPGEMENTNRHWGASPG